MKLIFTAALLIALTVLTGVTQAQTSSLSGQVTDMNGLVMPGIEVLAISKSKKEFSSRADSYGVYSFSMPGGSYRLEFKVRGCKNFVIPEYVLDADTNARLDAEIPATDCQLLQTSAPPISGPESIDAFPGELATEIRLRQSYSEAPLAPVFEARKQKKKKLLWVSW